MTLCILFLADLSTCLLVFLTLFCCVAVQITDFVRVDDEKFDAMQCGKFVDALACSLSVYTHHRCLTIVFSH